MRGALAVFVAVAAGRHADRLLKELAEGLFVVVAGGDHGFEDAALGSFQDLFCRFDPCTLEVFDKGHAGGLLESPREVAPAGGDVIDQLFDGVDLCIVFPDALLQLADQLVVVNGGGAEGGKIHLLLAIHVDGEIFGRADGDVAAAVVLYQ